MSAYRTSPTFDKIFLVFITLILILAALNRIEIGDIVFFATHKPSSQMIEVAADAGLTEAASHLLYRTNPQFDNSADIVKNCGPHQLGCLTGLDQSYLLSDPKKPNQTVVTAAHEMLHLAYQRLSDSQRNVLAPLIDQAIKINSKNIDSELSADTDTSDRRNEAHSLLGTEYAQLPSALVQYYSEN
jgi:hypothetical protein